MIHGWRTNDFNDTKMLHGHNDYNVGVEGLNGVDGVLVVEAIMAVGIRREGLAHPKAA